MPFLSWITQDPFDRARFVIETNDETLPARKEHRVVRAVIGRRVAVKPIDRPGSNELARVVSTCDHSLADDVDHVPAFEEIAGSVDFDKDGLILLRGVHIQKEAELSEVDIVIEKDRADVAVSVKQGDSPIELYAKEAGALSLIDSVIVKGGRFIRKACRADPAQCSIGVQDYWLIPVTTAALHQHVVVTQGSVVRSGLQDGRIVQAAGMN